MAFNASGGYQNPLRSANLTPERIDQGVDYSGSGPIYALGSGTIKATTNAGWPGGAFIVEELDSGSLAGRFIYYAENITPTVHVGEHVTSKTKAGDIHGGIEIGFADGSSGESMARSQGQTPSNGDAGGVSTGWGIAFNNVLKSLGAKGGIMQSKTQGSVPKLGPTSSGGGGGSSGTSGGGSGSPFDVSNIGKDLVDGLLSMLGVSDMTDFLERAALVILGIIFLLVGLWKVADPDGSKSKKVAKTATEAAVVA